MVLVYEGEGINWHFILTSTADEPEPDTPTFGGYIYDSPYNLWKTATYAMTFYYAHGDGWEGYPDGSRGFAVNGAGKYVVTLPYESNQQWQAQVAFHTDIVTKASVNYDFSAKFTSNTDA